MAFISCISILTRLFLQTRAVPAAVQATRSYAADAKATPTEVSSILEQRIRGVQEESSLAETGRVLSVGYGIEELDTIGIITDVAATVTVLPVSMA